MSQLTTHILNTSQGRPAAGVAVFLYHLQNSHWVEITSGTTNEDGRIPELLPHSILLEHGQYKLQFAVAPYFEQQLIEAFYPSIEIIFKVNSAEHYHVPLLLNPFGYSTYRGN